MSTSRCLQQRCYWSWWHDPFYSLAVIARLHYRDPRVTYGSMRSDVHTDRVPVYGAWDVGNDYSLFSKPTYVTLNKIARTEA